MIEITLSGFEYGWCLAMLHIGEYDRTFEVSTVLISPIATFVEVGQKALGGLPGEWEFGTEPASYCLHTMPVEGNKERVHLSLAWDEDELFGIDHETDRVDLGEHDLMEFVRAIIIGSEKILLEIGLRAFTIASMGCVFPYMELEKLRRDYFLRDAGATENLFKVLDHERETIQEQRGEDDIFPNSHGWEEHKWGGGIERGDPLRDGITYNGFVPIEGVEISAEQDKKAWDRIKAHARKISGKWGLRDPDKEAEA